METIEIYHYLCIASFLFALLYLFLAHSVSDWFYLFFVLFFVAFLVFAILRDKEINQNLDSLGCEYIGSGKKGMPHVPARKFYMCPDGIVRSN